MQALVAECSAGIQDPTNLIARAKATFGIDRDIDAEIVAATDEYNIAVTRKISDEGLTKLPRELRDMVYEFLVPQKVDIFAEPTVPDLPMTWGKEESTLYFASKPRTVDDGLCPEHYWRDEALGNQMIRELVERFYQASDFQVIPISYKPREFAPEVSTVSSILKHDRFEFGLEPHKLIGRFSH